MPSCPSAPASNHYLPCHARQTLPSRKDTPTVPAHHFCRTRCMYSHVKSAASSSVRPHRAASCARATCSSILKNSSGSAGCGCCGCGCDCCGGEWCCKASTTSRRAWDRPQGAGAVAHCLANRWGDCSGGTHGGDTLERAQSQQATCSLQLEPTVARGWRGPHPWVGLTCTTRGHGPPRSSLTVPCMAARRHGGCQRPGRREEAGAKVGRLVTWHGTLCALVRAQAIQGYVVSVEMHSLTLQVAHPRHLNAFCHPGFYWKQHKDLISTASP